MDYLFKLGLGASCVCLSMVLYKKHINKFDLNKVSLLDTGNKYFSFNLDKMFFPKLSMIVLNYYDKKNNFIKQEYYNESITNDMKIIQFKNYYEIEKDSGHIKYSQVINSDVYIYDNYLVCDDIGYIKNYISASNNYLNYYLIFTIIYGIFCFNECYNGLLMDFVKGCLMNNKS